MTRSERASQLWAVLALAATNRQILTYKMVSQLTGIMTPGVGQMLEPIQSFCYLQGLPPLTILVVRQESGLPGDGFTAASAAEFAKSLKSVYETDWLTLGNPNPDQLEAAVQEKPSNGHPLF